MDTQYTTVTGHTFTAAGETAVVGPNPRRVGINFSSSLAAYPYWSVYVDSAAPQNLVISGNGFTRPSFQFLDKDFGDLPQRRFVIKMIAKSAGTANVSTVEVFKSSVSGG